MDSLHRDLSYKLIVHLRLKSRKKKGMRILRGFLYIDLYRLRDFSDFVPEAAINPSVFPYYIIAVFRRYYIVSSRKDDL